MSRSNWHFLRTTVLLIMGLTAIAWQAHSANITYYVNEPIGSTGGVTGDIVTDGTQGSLDPGHSIVGWNLTVNEGPDGSYLLSSALGNSTFQNQALNIGGFFSATPTQLLFDFSNGAGSYFQGGNPQFVWCLQAGTNICQVGPAGQGVAVYGLSIAGDMQLTPISGVQIIATTTPTLPTTAITCLQGSPSPHSCYSFDGASSGAWFDPASSSGYSYEMTDGSLFTSILDLPSGFSNPFTVSSPGCTIPGTYSIRSER